jgi:small conductance mechanosensitive channel
MRQDGAAPETLYVVPGDTAAPAVAQPDTAGTLTQITRTLEETGRAVREGRYEDVIDQVMRASISFMLEGLIPALITIFFFYVIYRVVDRVLGSAMRRSRHVNEGVRQLVHRGVRLAIFSFAAVMVLDQIGMNVAALVAGLGIAGIALGFAARDTLENFISGIAILLDQPFRVGDNVRVGELFGTVQEITLRSTRLRTLNNELAVLPNTQMIQQMVINHSILGVLRVEIPFGIAYKEYPQEAREVALKTTEGDPRLHPDYPPKVIVSKMSDSSVEMRLWIFLKDPRLEVPIRFEYTERIREALREADIEVPFPHLQLFVDEAKAFEGTQLMAPRALPPGPQ